MSAKLPDMLGAIRASADGALKRLSGGTDAPAPTSGRAFFPLDPTRAFLPGETEEGEGPGAAPLSTLLEEAAHAMVRRKDDLAGLAAGLAARIEERRNGEIAMAAQAVRVVIGLVWLGVAVWLYNAALVARADGFAALPGGMPLAHAGALMETFLLVAAAGLGVAFAVGALARAFGNADNGRVAREAERFGAAVAGAAGEFDAALAALRGAMDRRRHPADAVDDLSRAHLTALEAHAFFREIAFITGADDDNARRLFRGFLARAARGGDGGAFAAILAFLSGGVLGGLGVYVLTAPTPDVPDAAPQAALAIMEYPWAAQLLILGGALYAGAGALLSFFSGPLTEGVAARARADALTALRSGFAAESSMGPTDVTRRIKDAVDVFRARVGGRPAASASHAGARTEFPRTGDARANQGAAFSADDDVPEWRRRDSSVKFVATDFAAAPQPFRTDAFAKKFSSPDDRNTAAKRGGEDLENGSGG